MEKIWMTMGLPGCPWRLQLRQLRRLLPQVLRKKKNHGCNLLCCVGTRGN